MVARQPSRSDLDHDATTDWAWLRDASTGSEPAHALRADERPLLELLGTLALEREPRGVVSSCGDGGEFVSERAEETREAFFRADYYAVSRSHAKPASLVSSQAAGCARKVSNLSQSVIALNCDSRSEGVGVNAVAMLGDRRLCKQRVSDTVSHIARWAAVGVTRCSSSILGRCRRCL